MNEGIFRFQSFDRGVFGIQITAQAVSAALQPIGLWSELDAGRDTVLCMTQMNLSARAYHRILKLARTIADLVGSEEIQSVHLVETLQYRPKLMVR